jgi:RNA polymerase sigma factor (TIGR02999 family)
MTEITQILDAIEQGDPHAAEQLLPLVYDELRRLAAEKMAQEKPGQTLEATALVHEAYLRLVTPPQSLPATEGDKLGGGGVHWKSRGHFFGAAAEAMRRILVENTRRKRTVKHGGASRRVDLDEAALCIEEAADEFLSLHEALDQLATEDPMKAELVKLRYFTGLSVQEAADILGISRATAERYWAYAKAWLYCAVRGEGKPDPR